MWVNKLGHELQTGNKGGRELQVCACIRCQGESWPMGYTWVRKTPHGTAGQGRSPTMASDGSLEPIT